MGKTPFPEDLSDDELLRDVKRDAEGRPVLGGIPLVAKIGQGTKCAVYYGTHPMLRKPVAVKVLLSSQDDEAVSRFVREGRAASRLTSPNLVCVFNASQESGLCYQVQEHVSGLSAAAYFDSVVGPDETGLPERDAITIVARAARGAAVAHDKGIVHRDITPRNILIPRAGPGSEFNLAGAKLSDLGSAKVSDGLDLTSAHATLGTPGFIAPEQIESAKNASFPADVFSLGATLYYLLTGSAPFEGTRPMDILLNTIQKDYTPIVERREEVSFGTVDVIASSLKKSPNARFANASTLLEALEGVSL